MSKKSKGINLAAPAAPAPQAAETKPAAATGTENGADEQQEETGGEEQQNDTQDGAEQNDDGQGSDETVTTEPVKTNSDTANQAATLIEPERGGPVRLRSTQFQMYHPYLRVYFHQDGGPDGKGTVIPFVDSWTKCQIDAGLLEEVPEDSNESVE